MYNVVHVCIVYHSVYFSQLKSSEKMAYILWMKDKKANTSDDIGGKNEQFEQNETKRYTTFLHIIFPLCLVLLLVRFDVDECLRITLGTDLW